ncbi:proline racemase family protein [Candidatus Formimonas warabiya]|uniref:Proline racemase n=1 Tax=Formimonas warabiya TaxID=1761012 RepID=A0A3G1KU29_FORW1|nr:proline racemase family protein [Candidatus Formimonas warabiya]ATW25927.1 proline racemase [Candidatus Formimonas warabiya]
MLKFSRIIHAIDAHTAGEPLRVITSGLPPIKGNTILEKRRFMLENYDHIRKMLMLEPRGHSGMYGCIITPPVTEDGDFGVIFTHNEGYSTMCGHGIIAVTKVVIETGMIEAANGVKVVKIDSPAGRVVACAEVRDGRVIRVDFENVPSFVYARDVKVKVGGIGEITVDIAYGGAFYVWVEAEKLGLEVTPKQMDDLVRRGMELKYQIMDQMKVVHPLEPELCGIYGTIITAPVEEVEGGLDSKNVCIFADAQIDRSPTGTGTSARVALLHAKGLLKKGMTLINKSIIDTPFTGTIKEFTKVADFDAVIPIVGGTAQIVGFNQLVLEPEDPLPEGFRITGG